MSGPFLQTTLATIALCHAAMVSAQTVKSLNAENVEACAMKSNDDSVRDCYTALYEPCVSKQRAGDHEGWRHCGETMMQYWLPRAISRIEALDRADCAPEGSMTVFEKVIETECIAYTKDHPEDVGGEDFVLVGQSTCTSGYSLIWIRWVEKQFERCRAEN